MKLVVFAAFVEWISVAGPQSSTYSDQKARWARIKDVKQYAAPHESLGEGYFPVRDCEC